MDNQFFKNQLIEWYQSQRRDLPWRKTKEPYKIWLSEIILQQTRVIQGLPYYERFVENFPSVFELANAEQEQVMKLWQGLGYYSRAKNLHHTAKKIAFEFDGVFPKSYKELIKLKGIGDYTASAIASICYSEPCAVVDGNVYRVLARVFNIEIPINTSEGISYFKELANSLLYEKDAGTYNQALMDFGATQCKPQSPDCQSCMFSDKCLAKSLQKVNELPRKNGKIKIKKRLFNYLVFIDNKGFTSLNKRYQKDIWQGLYEFPLLESENELSQTEITDRVKKEFGLFSDIYLFNEKSIVHKLSHQHIYTRFWIVEIEDILSNPVDIKEVTSYPVSVLTANFIKEFWF
ncbi:A/G-specific adenine glycosylase [Capnocytophaga stomatis]|uniref:Adenine DNA glycosylase n=1 Tax=Capnocytophaga stomatis TaxID=1848904 RepID=A0A250FY21_9FLAO|nr:A/G-specific adenine glycosylase [Capnocytophaga stomatis]ATA88886.1 A/G-specific adenine glycosylase [Capnocytophaga stomatis]